MAAPFVTDSLNPSALPSSTLGRRRAAPAGSSAAGAGSGRNDPDAVRGRFHEEWNVRIDREVKAVAGALKEIVDLADIGPNPSAHSPTPTYLHLRLRTAQLIRSAQGLRDMAHELRLMLLLSDEVDTARRRDGEMVLIRDEIGERRRGVQGALKGLMNDGSAERDDSEGSEGRQASAATGGNPQPGTSGSPGGDVRVEVVEGDNDEAEDDFEEV